MTWHTEVLNDRMAGYIGLEREMPYALALLLHPQHRREEARNRAKNYLAARRAECTRSPNVTHAPYHIVIDPSDVCNLRCPLCVHVTDPKGRQRTRMSMDQASRLLNKFGPLALRLDLFNWGEPLLNPNFAEIVAEASDLGLYTRTSSHFSFDPPLDWDRIVASGLRYIVASVDGSSEKAYRAYRKGGSLSAVHKNLRALRDAKQRANSVWPVLEWQFLAFRHNVQELDDVRKNALDLGADLIRCGGARAEMGSKTMIASADGVARSQDFLLESSHPLSEYDESGAKRRVEELSHCRWLWGKLAIHADGRLAPCWNGWRKIHDMGDTNEAEPLALWNSKNFRQARQLAETGGDPSCSTLCGPCAHHRSFVPPPDRDDEPIGDIPMLANAAQTILQETGHLVGEQLRQELSAILNDPEVTCP